MSILDRNGHAHGGDGRYTVKQQGEPGGVALAEPTQPVAGELTGAHRRHSGAPAGLGPDAAAAIASWGEGLDAATDRQYTNGDCADLALALHARTGWPLATVGFLTDEDDPHSHTWVHAGVVAPDGRFLDVRGFIDEDEVLDGHWGDVASDAQSDFEDAGEIEIAQHPGGAIPGHLSFAQRGHHDMVREAEQVADRVVGVFGPHAARTGSEAAPGASPDPRRLVPMNRLHESSLVSTGHLLASRDPATGTARLMRITGSLYDPRWGQTAYYGVDLDPQTGAVADTAEKVLFLDRDLESDQPLIEHGLWRVSDGGLIQT